MFICCGSEGCSSVTLLPKVLITEAVLCHGGTQQLVRILNRLGAAACLDTVNRLATQVVEKRVSSGTLSDLVPQRFAAVSIDNIDILHHLVLFHAKMLPEAGMAPRYNALSHSPSLVASPRMTSFPLLQYRPLSVPNVHAVLLFILR